MSINGQDPRSNVYLLDGTLMNDFTNGPAGSAAGTALGLDTIREFRVQANAYSAEFGRNSGGQINVLTKSGTNRLSGSAFEFHRNDAMDARNYFDTAGKPDFHRNQFGGTVGGPIARRTGLLLPRLRRADRAARPHDLDGGARRQRAARDPADRHGAGQSGGRSRTCGVPARQRAIAWPGARRVHLPVRPEAGSALRAGAGRLQRFAVAAVLRPLHARRHEPVPADRLIRSSRASSSRATSSSPASTGRCFSDRTLNTTRLGFSRTRIGQNVESNTTADAARVRPRPRICRARSTSAA